MFEMLLGHLVGDYLLQNDWMALEKGKHNGMGWFKCTVHCVLYTIAVCTLMGLWNAAWVLAVFFSHFVVDKFGIPDMYLRAVNGRSIHGFLTHPENGEYSAHICLRGGFTAVVYAVCDNTMHLLLMFISWKILYT